MADVGDKVTRGDRQYVVVDCDEHYLKLQVLKDGRPGRGRPVSMPKDRFETWLNPRAVSQFGDKADFMLNGARYHLISYDSVNERFTLRGVNDDGSYRRGRPRLLHIEDFTAEDQARIKQCMSDT